MFDVVHVRLHPGVAVGHKVSAVDLIICRPEVVIEFELMILAIKLFIRFLDFCISTRLFVSHI